MDGCWHARSPLERGAEEYGVRLDFRPPGAPHYGGHIERLIGTTMGAVHLLPGTTFSNVAEKGDYSSESAACLTLLELERWLALQITGVYHQAVPSVLGRPPIVAWQEGLALRGQPPRLPADPETFFLDFLPGETRLIRRDGIQFSHIFYWDNILSPLAGRSPKPVLIKYDPRNIERIYFLDANGRYWPIPYRDLGHPPVSLWEHRQALKQLRADGRRVVDEKVIFETILMQRKIVESGRQSTRSRRQEERRNQSKNGNALPTADTSAQPDYSALPPFDVEEWND